MEKNEQRTIPQPIRREVRKRCGFGCVICGSPIYHYDHMMDWAIYKRHRADEITLLCPTHHQEKNSGLLSLQTIKKHNEKPVNKSALFSPKWKINYEQEIRSVIGGMVFNPIKPAQNLTEEFFSIFIQIGHQPIIWFDVEEGNLLLNVFIYQNNQPILLIKNNELVYMTELWDVEFVGRTLSIREGHRRIVVKITFDVNANEVRFESGNLTLYGRELKIREDYMELKTGSSRLKFSGGSMTNVKVGFQI